MSADWISIYQEVFDQDKVDAYARLARPAFDGGAWRYMRIVPAL